MNIIKAGVSGKFIFSDPKTKEKIAEFKNDISDYGMQRLSGFTSHNAYAVAENFEFIHLGESDNPVNRINIFKLIQPLVPGTDVQIVHGSVADAGVVPSPTRTEYVRNTSGDVVVRFINNWDVTFDRNVVIREVGTSHVDYQGSTRPRGSGYSGTFNTDNSSRVNLNDNINQSLFSRAVLSPSQPFSSGTSVRVTYVCEITLCSTVEWVQNLLIDTSTLPSPLSQDTFPSSKINMRQKPFYDLNNLGKASNYFITGGNPPNTGVKTCPVLDSFAEPARGVWILDSFLYDDYLTFTSTMTSTVIVAGNPVPQPATSVRISKTDGDLIPKTAATRHYSPSSGGYTVDHPTQDEWNTTLRFLIRTEDMPTSPSAKTWTLWRAFDTNQQIPTTPDYRAKTGLTFTLQQAYLPSANKLFGLDFVFTWSR